MDRWKHFSRIFSFLHIRYILSYTLFAANTRGALNYSGRCFQSPLENARRKWTVKHSGHRMQSSNCQRSLFRDCTIAKSRSYIERTSISIIRAISRRTKPEMIGCSGVSPFAPAESQVRSFGNGRKNAESKLSG